MDLGFANNLKIETELERKLPFDHNIFAALNTTLNEEIKRINDLKNI